MKVYAVFLQFAISAGLYPLVGQSFAYVANAGSGTISGYAVNATSGELTPLAGSPFADPVCSPGGSCPVWVAADPSAQFLYVTEAALGLVSTLQIDPASGALSPVPGSTVSTGGTSQNITLDPSGDFAYVVNVLPGTIAAFRVNRRTGILSRLSGPAGTTSLNGAQSYVAGVHPSGRALYVGTLSGIFGFAINRGSGALTPLPGSPWPGSALVSIHPTGRFLYSGGISYSIDPQSSVLAPIADSSYIGSRGAVINPAGDLFYTATDSGGPGTPDSVYGYAINAVNGTLTLLDNMPMPGGQDAGWSAMDPDGRFLYVVNTSGGGDVSGFSVEASTGVLTPISGSPFANGFGPQGIAVVRPPTPVNAITSLIALVNNLTELSGVERRVLANVLGNAHTALQRGSLDAAKGELNAFVNQVRALRNRGEITDSSADTLIATALAIIAVI